MINKEKFYTEYRKQFGKLKQYQVNTINSIIDYFESEPLLRFRPELAYILATATHEANLKTDIREFGRGLGRKYGKVYWPTGQRYYGRGLCQLTWWFNYDKLGNLLDIDLLNNPDLALETNNSVKILIIGMLKGLFTGHSLREYVKSNENFNFVPMRKIINGMDKANYIANIAYKYLNIINLSNE